MVADNAGANMAHEEHTPNMYKRAKLSGSSQYWSKLRTMRNRVTAMLCTSKQSFFNRNVNTFSSGNNEIHESR